MIYNNSISEDKLEKLIKRELRSVISDRQYIEDITQFINNEYSELYIMVIHDILYPFEYKIRFYSEKIDNKVMYINIDFNDTYINIFNKIKETCDKITNRHNVSEKITKRDNISNNISSHNCTNCGATLNINSFICEYCGTQYW